jgi:hypothetical protein
MRQFLQLALMSEFKAFSVRQHSGAVDDHESPLVAQPHPFHNQAEKNCSHLFPRQRDTIEAGWVSPGSWPSSESGDNTCSCFSASPSYDVRSYGLVVNFDFNASDLRVSPLSMYCRRATLSWYPGYLYPTAARVNETRGRLPFSKRYAMRASRITALGWTTRPGPGSALKEKRLTVAFSVR